MNLPQTTRQNWQVLYNELFNSSDHSIEVNINFSDDINGDITNLRYFFPLASYLLRENKINVENPLVLDIHLSDKEKEKDNDLGRLRAFFSQMVSSPAVRINVDGKNLPTSAWTASRIFPLCQVQNSSDASEFSNYKVLEECLYDPLTKHNCVDGFSNQYASLGNALLTYVREYTRYIGVRDRNFTEKEKIALSDEVNAYLNECLPNMTILSQLIWLLILRELQKSKLLYTIPSNSNDAPQVHKNILAKSQIDAVSYGEGVYQLIENACIHSYGKKAWFGFRIYESNRNSTMKRLTDDVHVRKNLYERYELCFKSFPESNGNDKNIFDEGYSLFFEFFVMDDAADKLGMVGTYNRTVFREERDWILPHFLKILSEEERKSFHVPESEEETKAYRDRWIEIKEKAQVETKVRQRVSSVDDLFNIKIREDTLEKHIEDIIIHYGLRLLQNIISLNNGYLLGRTPNGTGETQFYFNGNFVPDEKRQEKRSSYVTDWSAILPITDLWPENKADEGAVNGQNCFGTEIERPRQNLYYTTHTQIFHGIAYKVKREDILQISSNLSAYLSRLEAHALMDSVILLDVGKCTPYQLEVFAKALFSQIATIHREQRESAALRIALLLNGKELIHEFIRLFSAFYQKGIQPDMEGVQIALCKKRDEYADVSVMLAGDCLKNVYYSARLFAYHHSEDTLEYLPLLDYLTTQKDMQPNPEYISLFPFELCLPAQILSKSKQLLNWKDNWFIRRMNRLLNSNIQEPGYGCKIEDTHIRLGSKIHLTQFYEAELLFHNMGNIARFAYMLAQELLFGAGNLVTDKQVLLLGYKEYSAPLILQVEYWLKQSHQFEEVYAAIVYDDVNEGKVNLRTFFEQEINPCPQKKEIQEVAILPVGTTLSTIYKMHNTAEKELKKWFGGCWVEATGSWNFCLILVNQDLNTTGCSKMTSRYWCNVEREQQQVTVRREHASGTETQVKYLIGIDAKWMDPHCCEICKKNGKDIRPIIDGKQSNTIPGAIFNLWEKHAGSYKRLTDGRKANSNAEIGKKSIAALYGNTFYSHVYLENNHFQYYIDFQKVFVENYMGF